MFAPSYLKAIVIVHGKSEKIICDYVKSNLKLKLSVVSDKRGEKSIQINGLLDFLKRMEFKDLDSFFQKYINELPPFAKELPNDFKVFVIMDTDDCSDDNKIAYMNSALFKTHWLKDYIVPIYNININNLEDVMEKAGIPVRNKKDYIKIFPINKSGSVSNVKEIRDLSEKLKKYKNITNLHEFFDFCLNLLQ